MTLWVITGGDHFFYSPCFFSEGLEKNSRRCIVPVLPRPEKDQTGKKGVVMKTMMRLIALLTVVCAFSAQGATIQSGAGASRLRDVKTVIDGVLYRGGSIGMKPLSQAQLRLLCEQGVSHAVYLYDTGFAQVPEVSCTMTNGQPNSITYSMNRFLRPPEVEKVMRSIHASIENGERGSVFVHCWNGWHASGEIAAQALKQFCDYSDEQAAEYWKNNIGDKGNLPKYGRVLARIKGFKVYPQFKISLKRQAEVCPRP